MTSRTIGKYRIVEKISQSGMATVYKAVHPVLDRFVAIKVLNRTLVHSPEMLERFRREARAIAALQHPHIVQVFDFDTVDGMYFMVMEYIEGETLAQRLTRLHRRGERMPLLEVLRTIADVGRALDYAHRQGMLHRDIKPSNVMFRADGSAVLTDFGVAKILDAPADITATGAVAGTPAYMAPEQWTDDEPDHRSDIYSLGVVLFQAATGELPFKDATPGRLMYKHISEPPPLPRTVCPDIPPDLEWVILHAMAKSPQDRYQTAGELAGDLEAIIYQLERTARTGIFERPVLHGGGRDDDGGERRSRRAWLAVGALVLLAIVAGVMMTGAGSDSSDPQLTVTALAGRLVQLEATLTTAPTPSPVPPTATRAPTKALAMPTTTPQPLPSPTPCVLTMTLQRDVNFYDANWWNLVNASFYKTWRVLNDGGCAWPEGTVLVPLDGERFGMDEPFQVGPVLVGEEKELSVPLQAPAEPGFYEGFFQLQTASGEPIGEPLVVGLEARLEPPATPTASEATEPVRLAGFDLIEWTADPGNHVWRGKIRLWARGGNGQYTWYRDTLDNPLPGDILEFEWGICRDFFGSVWVTSGDTVDHEGLYVPYPEPCD